MYGKYVNVKANALSKEECAQILNSHLEWEKDVYKADTMTQNRFMDKETLEANTITDTSDNSRSVEQAPYDCFAKWDGLPVYRSKVMKYEEGDYCDLHADSQWMCQSNYWKPNTNKVAKDLMVIPLNDGYEGGEVIVGKNSTVIDQKIGDCIQMSQSGSLAGHRVKHGVKKITKGTRYALVFWNFQ